MSELIANIEKSDAEENYEYLYDEAMDFATNSLHAAVAYLMSLGMEPQDIMGIVAEQLASFSEVPEPEKQSS